jgi:hypothetical protein
MISVPIKSLSAFSFFGRILSLPYFRAAKANLQELCTEGAFGMA